MIDPAKLSYGCIMATQAAREAAKPLRALKLQSKTAAELPKKHVLPDVDHHYQNGWGMCFACVETWWVAHAYRLEYGALKKFSPGFAYGHRIKNTYKTEGMVVNLALADLIDNGLCEFADYPRLGNYLACAAGITDAMRQKAKPLHAASAVCLYPEVANSRGRTLTADRITEIKNYIYSTKLPVLYNMYVYAKSYQTNPVGMVAPGDWVLDCHALLLVGWDDSIGCWIMQNSQASRAEDKTLVPYMYNGGQDFWTVADYIAPVIITPPDPPVTPDDPDPPPKPPEPPKPPVVPEFTGFEWQYVPKKKKLTIKITKEGKKLYSHVVKPDGRITKSSGFSVSKLVAPFKFTVYGKDGSCKEIKVM